MKLNLNVVFFDRILLTNQKIQYSRMKKNQRFDFTTEHWSRRWIMLFEVLGATPFILSLFDLHI